jgi:hypothetical protein
MLEKGGEHAPGPMRSLPRIGVFSPAERMTGLAAIGLWRWLDALAGLAEVRLGFPDRKGKDKGLGWFVIPTRHLSCLLVALTLTPFSS